MTTKAWTLYLDQYGNRWKACTIKELCEKIGGRSLGKMYVDRAGKTYHVGHIVKADGTEFWCTAHQPVEIEA